MKPIPVVLIPETFTLAEPAPVIEVGGKREKMSKSRGNVVTPDEIIEQYGADTLRLYLMYMGPLEQSKPWETESISGMFRFLNRLWRLMIDEHAETNVIVPEVKDVVMTTPQKKLMHRLIVAVTEDIEALHFNIAIGKLIGATNEFVGKPIRPLLFMETLVLLVSPFAPHIAEELWEALGHAGGISAVKWPEHDPKYLVDETIEVPIQVNGKLKGRIQIAPGSDIPTYEAKAREEVAEFLEDKIMIKVVVIPNRMVNFVVR
jgi:leucyl-tRNA synthetase